MKTEEIMPLISHLVEIANGISHREYDRAGKLFEFTAQTQYPPQLQELAEAFGMMMVQVEAREFNLEQLILKLEKKNEELEKTLAKVKMLESVKSHLDKFVPESVKHLIMDNPDNPDFEKRDKDVSVLFLDIAGYTRISEHVDREQLNRLIEVYFSSFLDDILQNKGDINETAGDGLMIIFQDDSPPRHALNAVKTALAIQRKTAANNRARPQDQDAVAVNIGVNSGIGLVGSTRFEGLAGTRWTFTATGPVTNIAARLMGLAAGGRTYVGPETFARVGDRFSFESIGAQRLKNVARPLEVYELIVDEPERT